MTGRDTVLARIREALSDVPDDETPQHLPVPRDYRRSHADTDPVTLFAERVADYRAGVHRATPGTARDRIAELLTARKLEKLIVPPGFPEELIPDGPWRYLTEPLGVSELEAADGVLTTSTAGVAVTGTIVLNAGPGQGRRILTLLPDYHLCVVRADRITGDVPGALDLLDPARPLTFISGPSATSDIELDRVEGVHGPRTLDVLIIHEEPPA
ncbi:lactate utilization protein C [Streptomyces sp. NPDC020800]|uniref:lactate utilization protein C n=1 Tax=Streptomyces sp. NPDC020800 TaxID=3365092 RepID=UPI0037A7F5D2